MWSVVITAEAGIQKNEITGFRIKCGMTKIWETHGKTRGIANLKKQIVTIFGTFIY
jgi:hypothetical protein